MKKSLQHLSWRQQKSNRHLPEEMRLRFVSKPKARQNKWRYSFNHGPWKDLITLLLLAISGFYFLFALPPAIFWTLIVNNPKFKYQERTIVITSIKEHVWNSRRPNTIKLSSTYLKRTAYSRIDGKEEAVGLPSKLDHLQVGDCLKVAYCPDRLEGTFCGWYFRMLPMSSFENRKRYMENFLYTVWGPLMLIGMGWLIRTVYTMKQRITPLDKLDR
ncbi:MAG: hypothetical protein ACI4QJ_07540 [Candidatus Spyradenecus sp.]